MDELRSLHVSPPRLLVSVRDAVEVAAAIEGGCDILDVKDPKRGSLGRADLRVWNTITAEMQKLASPIPCSAALGEIIEETEFADALRLPLCWNFAKLGTAGLGRDDNWQSRVADAQSRWRQRASSNYRWILVVYADAKLAGSPSLTDVRDRLPELLSNDSWDGILIDTFTKNGSSLFDFVESSQLIELGEVVRQSGKLWCVAGSLRAEILPEVLSLCPDIVGIRTAGCRDGRRDQPIVADAVKQFRDAMQIGFEEKFISPAVQR
ncbi:MAG: hypothetical protein O2955_07780 [Planctomycetota bacterium]|nr:hypothetical protein [Planctomycetota bacterium]MDA1212400.1 hypothetical protein [Planctomycetota bacterium]